MNRRNVAIGIGVTLAIGGVVAAVAVGIGGSSPGSSKVEAGRERATTTTTSTPGSTTAATVAAPTSSSPEATTTPTTAPPQTAAPGGTAATAPPATQDTTPATAPPTQPTVATTVPPCPTSGGNVTIVNIAYNPSSLSVAHGTTVTWAFNDNCRMHSVTSDTNAFDSGIHSTGTFQFTFANPGTFTYHCVIHGNATTGTITVT